MAATARKAHAAPDPAPHRRRFHEPAKLGTLSSLGSVDIETALLANLSRDLHTLFDPISDGALPIYFGPLLGRLYLEGL